MACDLFNNSNGPYVNPNFSCSGDNGDKFETVDNGLGIVNGSTIKSKVDLSGLSIPVNSYNKQTQVISSGEVIFIQGLSKGLIKRKQVFEIPALGSIDNALDPYFLDVDLSINYYNNFAYTTRQIDASGNYSTTTTLATALTSAFSSANVKARASYDTSALTFTGTLDGYDFEITNVVLNVIDASQNASSPYPTSIIDGERVPQTYTLSEDVSLASIAAKYPNTAFRGIVLNAKYPTTYGGSYVCQYNSWLYVNHAKSPVVTFDPVTLTFDSSVNVSLLTTYDPSTFLGIKPTIVNDVSIGDSSSGISINLTPTAIIDGSTILSGLTIDNSTLTDVSIGNSIITDTSIIASSVYDSSVTGGSITAATYTSNSIITDVSIENSYFSEGKIINSSFSASGIGGVNGVEIINTVLYPNEYSINSDVSGGVSYGDLSASAEFESSIGSVFHDVILYNKNSVPGVYLGEWKFKGYQLYNLEDPSADNSNGAPVINAGNILAIDSSIYNISMANSSTIVTIDESVIWNANILTLITYNSHISDTSVSSIGSSDFKNSELHNVNSPDGNVFNSKIYDSSLATDFEDSSIYTSHVSGHIYTSYLEDTSIYSSVISDSDIVGGNVWDSSIGINTVINNDASISNSLLLNVWTNTYVSGSLYTMSDADDIDTAAWRVNINTSVIWDSSINNTTVRDSSIYNSYIQDSSIIGCTTYNCIFDQSADIDTRTIQIDASLTCDVSIFQDSSIYYNRQSRTLDVGMSGASTSTKISSGDYLTYITANELWDKIGELYAWTAAADPSSATPKNFLDGMYVYNPQSFPVTLDYMVFV